MRTKHQIHVLGGHTNAVSSLITHAADPQIITGSHDSTIKVLTLLFICRALYGVTLRCFLMFTPSFYVVHFHINSYLISYSHILVPFSQLWDLAAGRCMTTLTQHKKAVRSLAANPRVSVSASEGLIAYERIVVLLLVCFTLLYFSHHPSRLFLSLMHSLYLACSLRQEFTFLSGGADNIKKWQCRDGR